MGAAFEELVGVHLNDLYGTALCCTGSPERAEELLCDVLRETFHEFPPQEGAQGFRLWVLEMLARACLERVRHRGTRPSGVAETASAPAEIEPAAPGVRLPEPGTPAYAAVGDMLRSALRSLDVETRMSVWLVNVLGLRYREAARCLGVSVQDVMASLARGRRRLHAELADKPGKAAGAV
ncbi:MAG: hypothetical protein HY702_00450 [Gemmatimonadetes bacterium]|nr:hypothetical protein [Gemmatimonadota bacterium]